MVGSSQKRGAEQARCVHPACFKGIPGTQRTAGSPGARSSLGLFIPANRSGEPVGFIRSQQVRDPSGTNDVFFLDLARYFVYLTAS